ncbi:hypothetical protein [Hansschlegelia sp. KR7-227]|jgi:hypothetical protein|uniref:hypothetical protein n=1 Tax=Hansschlegelia sp. KR7-227 TaxID=3400914 RepID=UPI003C0D958B
MPVTIVLSVCLVANAATCRQERIEFTGSPMACVVSAQPIVAEWGADHPEWRVTSWKCGRG